MIETIHRILLGIHIPFGAISLILFWIPVGLQKGSSKHKQFGRYYYRTMWVVLISSALLSVCNTIMGNYMAAIYLGFLTLITAYPLWYSYEILQQKGEWTNRYYLIRRVFLGTMLVSGIALVGIGGIMFQFKGMGTMMVFFGIIGLLSGREMLMSKTKAMIRETRIKMHIQGTIISGIAAYTAFFAFGGSRIFIQVLHMHHQWMVIPWIAPTLLGVLYMRYMKRMNKVG